MSDGAPTPLDFESFLAALADAGGDPGRYAERPPRTLEQLFLRLQDPDEFGPATVAALCAARFAIERRSTTLAADPCLSAATVYPGDLRVTGNFTFGSHVLVLGDLDVERVVTAVAAHAILMVAGRARCRAMQLARGYLFVTGDVVVEECFLGTLHGLAKVCGRIAAPLYLHDDSWANLELEAGPDDEATESNVDARLKLDVGASGARESLAAMLRPGLLVGDDRSLREGLEELGSLFEKLAAGERILR